MINHYVKQIDQMRKNVCTTMSISIVLLKIIEKLMLTILGTRYVLNMKMSGNQV